RHAASVRPEPGSNSPLKTNRSWFIERAISSFLMLAILLYKRSNLYFIIHLFSFQRTCLTSFV
ncbi:hypothetical protein, partial [Paenibacillus polymyxa]|uniref:hypothetical protein n=1 Tax=Paenibacillus polymyxa TaxID=1406 RepID=UPI001E57381C